MATESEWLVGMCWRYRSDCEGNKDFARWQSQIGKPCNINILCMTERQLIKYANVFFSDKQECLRLGKSAYRQGLHEEAMALLGGAGSKVDADAQFMIGQMYAKGRGVEKNKEIAEEWYWKAANHGHAAAALELEKGINRAKAYWKRKEQELIDEIKEFTEKLLQEDLCLEQQ